MPEPSLKTLLFDDVVALEDRDGSRYELWEGQPHAMTGGTRAHNRIALGLRDIIKSQIPRACDVFVADMALRLSPEGASNRAYPDVMVTCNADPGSYQTSPILVAEVLSESSVNRDRTKKLNAYTAIESVQAYLILSQTAIEIEVYRRVNGWREEIYRGGDALIELVEPNIRLPLRGIYQDAWDDLA
ncbi:MAG: Uma2 family endonuclease [Gammaproteobacteria bacterium]